MNSQEPTKEEIEPIITLINQKKYSLAYNLSNKILENYPNSILANNIAGVVQTYLSNYILAEKFFLNVISLNPNFDDGYYNLANIYIKLEKEDKAIQNYNKVIEINRNYYKAYNNLGNIFRKNNLNKKALDNYITTLVINPNYLKGYYNLAGILQHFTFEEKNEYINNFYLYLLEQKKIVRPNSIAKNIIHGLYLNTDLKIDFVSIESDNFLKNFNNILKNLNNNRLLLQFMKVCPIPSYIFEKNLLKLRKEILNKIYDLNFDNNYFKFLISLSSQCFLNEYIYLESKVEKTKIKEIEKRVEKNINNNKPVNDLEILILSCYAPLHSFDWCDKILVSENLIDIFKLQYQNYINEKKQLLSIKSISEVNDRTSIKVKKQYEENPYPRWTNLGLSFEAKNIEDVFRYKNLNLDIKKVKFSKQLDILVSGCGTGQHVITTASIYKNAKIYALDLSFKSLSYAKRKTEELGLKNIKFLQGDILDVKKLKKKFDLIESVGVLHHMNDPFLGWKTLTCCLKDNSLMWIGLYSEKARKHITEIRKNINYLNIKTKKENIINFRNEIFENQNTEWNRIKNSPDFYSTSGVRDLLFHIKEHTFTIQKIKEHLNNLNLDFLGFEDTSIVNKFKQIYKENNDLYDLDKWEEFENNNHKIFAGMYQFWCKKKIKV